MAYNRDAWRASNRNGDIPRDRLAQVTPTQWDADLGGPAILHPEAAAAMSALLGAAPAGLAVKYSYRTLAKQWEKWNMFGSPRAASPGTSNHGWAVAVDFTGMSWAATSWLRANSRRFGWANDVPWESWHYTYQGGWKGDVDDMTPEQKKQIAAALETARDANRKVDAIVAGMTRFIQDEPAPARDGLVKRTWRAFTKAAG